MEGVTIILANHEQAQQANLYLRYACLSNPKPGFSSFRVQMFNLSWPAASAK
jgi:hypothetical protein